MTTGIILALMGLVSSQIVSDNVIGSIEVTPSIEIVEIPSEFSVFRQVGCDKYVNVFGVHIFANPTTSGDKLSHAAGVLAQYLDNDEDGVPDNTRVLSHLVSRNVFLIYARNRDGDGAVGNGSDSRGGLSLWSRFIWRGNQTGFPC